jgi:hypothetical protein
MSQSEHSDRPIDPNQGISRPAPYRASPKKENVMWWDWEYWPMHRGRAAVSDEFVMLG